MTLEEAIKTLKENVCLICAYGSKNIDECDIRYCDNRESLNVAIEALKNQKTVIEELEKIKAKIEKLNNTDYGRMFSYEAHKGAGDMQDDIIGIIENRIAELKGEQK